jgi:hypothetical protein
MQAIEFETMIKNGAIVIPPQHQQTFANSTQVKVILLKQEASSQQGIDMISELLNHPLEIENFMPTTRDELHDR